MIKWIRFILRLGLLAVAVGAAALSVSFFYRFHTLTIEQVSDLLNMLSSQPILFTAIGVGVLLFLLSLLGLIMLMQYQVWRYPLSVFIGYGIGVYLYYEFHLMHPFQDSVLQLNDEGWYYPFFVASALLLRAIVGFKLPQLKKQALSNS